MQRQVNPLIAELAADLEPVRPLKIAYGIALAAVAAIGTVLLVEVMEGLWRGMLAGRASPFYFIANGMLGLLGASSALAVLRMAQPHVGNTHDGARWSFGMVSILPITGLLIMTLQGNVSEVINDRYGVSCFTSGTGLGFIVAAALVFWLRRGAPVSLNAAGMFTGVAAGSIGMLAYGLSCPIDHAGHLGIWHVAPIAVSAVVGRLAVPHLVRW
jgi:hypothetical protein